MDHSTKSLQILLLALLSAVNIGSAHAEVAKAKLCDDLFSSSCLDEKGNPKFTGKLKDASAALSKEIAEARDASAKQLGYVSFADGLKKRLKESGIDLIEPISQAYWDKLTRVSSGGSGLVDAEAKDFFAAAKFCADSTTELSGKSFYGEKNPEILKTAIQKAQNFKQRIKADNIRSYSKDIPNFLSSSLVSVCSSLKNLKIPEPGADKKAVEDPNARARKICETLPALKRQAIELFRIEGTPGYKEKAEKFVTDNYPGDLNYGYGSYGGDYTIPGSTPRQKTELELLSEQASQASSGLPSCYTHSSAIENAATKVFEDYAQQINIMKPTIDGVLGTAYSAKNRSMAEGVLKNVKTDVQAIVGQFVKDPAKKTEIVDGYDGLELLWMEPPSDSAYKTDAKGNRVLDLEKDDKSYGMKFGYGVAETFQDASLSFFTTFNADYSPKVKQGKLEYAERVNMMPVMLKLAEQNPGDFLSTISHEAGHRIGPSASKINGFDLTPEYRELTACFKTSGSINLQKGQDDEAVADFISAEVMARQLARMPKEKRQTTLTSAMSTLCIAGEASPTLSCKGSHPESSLRIAGIYGANANLRKVVGCEGASPKFASCGLKSVGLPKDDGPSAAPVTKIPHSGTGAVK